MKTPEILKQEAGYIRDFLRAKSIDVPHSSALELAAKLGGFKDLH